MHKMNNIQDIHDAVQQEKLALLLIKSGNCGVCDSLEAKLSVMLKSHTAEGLSVYIEDAPDAASAFLALSAPTVLLFAEGREVFRAGRFVRLDELEQLLSKYEVMLDAADN